MMNHPTVKHLTIKFDQDLEWNLQRAMALVEEKKKYSSDDSKWQKIENELSDAYYEIGFSIVYDMMDLPF